MSPKTLEGTVTRMKLTQIIPSEEFHVRVCSSLWINIIQGVQMQTLVDDDDDDDGGDEEEEEEPHDGDDHDNDGKNLKNTTNKEPKKWGVWKMMFLSNWVIFRFLSPFIFRGAPTIQLKWHQLSSPFSPLHWVLLTSLIQANQARHAPRADPAN